MLRASCLFLALAALATACGGDAATAPERATVAFVMIGDSDDLGYNQAVHDGTLEVARRFPDIEILRVPNVPETEESARIMRELVTEEGADLIFATSFGHLPHAYAVAQDHPEVIFVHQGGLEPQPGLHNFGTYFGSHWEAMYEAGIAAGHATTTGVMGFVAAFPIPATYANANAFTLGAQRVRPDIRTVLLFTESWCDPDLQRAAVADLVDRDVDVLALHQDCTTAILEEAERRQLAGVVGYHADGSEIAATRWLGGAVWTWGDLYAEIVADMLDGTFESGPYTGDFRGSLADGNNPFTLTEPGPATSAVAQLEMVSARRELADGWTPFTGPMTGADGEVHIAEGVSLSVLAMDQMDWFVAGIEAP